jgi:uncharacterized protein YdeI (YjbR/CyaY-like superfamily)
VRMYRGRDINPGMQKSGREPELARVPPDLRKVLVASPKAKAQWDDLTPIARRDFISWVDSAKQQETRKRRVESVPGRLASGKRRPCCYALVPMNLYKAIGSLPKAKAQWKTLTPNERRDFVDWIDSAKDSPARTQRIEKACVMLLNEKRHP